MADFRTSPTWATRDSWNGKLQFSKYNNIQNEFSYAKYMLSKQKIGGEYREWDNRQKWLETRELLDSLVRHVKTVELIYEWFHVYEEKVGDVVTLHWYKEPIETDWEKKNMIDELNATEFNEKALKLQYLTNTFVHATNSNLPN